MNLQDLFSNFYLCYLEGDYLKVPENWGQKNVSYLYTKMYYIMGGECEIVIKDQVYIAKAGDFFYIPNETQHSFRLISDNRVEKYYFHFCLEINNQLLDELIPLPNYFHLGINEEIKEICENILQFSQKKSLGAALSLKSSLLSLISFYVSLHEFSPVLEIPEKNQGIARVVDYIKTNLDKKITLQELANIAYLHPNYLCRLFKSCFGITPLQYVYQKKMDYSRYLLLYTQISISEIAAMVGYDDISHFSKDFKKYSHCPPRHFRSQTLKERQWQFPYRI